MKKERKELHFEKLEHYADLNDQGDKSYVKEFNLIKWDDNEPKYDIRMWFPYSGKYSKGLTFSKDEISRLKKALNAMDDI